MTRLRSFLSILLAAIATFIVSCGGPSTTQVPTYTATQLQQIQVFTSGVQALRDRFPELEDYIQNKKWVDIRAFIHGPMGELRVGLSRLANRLLPQDAPRAKALVDDLANHLERLDAAAAAYNQFESGEQYRLALDAFDAFLQLVPTGTAE